MVKKSYQLIISFTHTLAISFYFLKAPSLIKSNLNVCGNCKPCPDRELMKYNYCNTRTFSLHHHYL